MSEADSAGRDDAGGFDFKLYRYNPSLPAAIIALVVFAILTAAHTWKIARHRSLYFIPFTVGLACKSLYGLPPILRVSVLTQPPVETIGYGGRIWSHYDELSIGGFVIQAILILVAPALYAASIYMILGRLIRTVRAEHMSLLPVQWVTRIFVTCDVVSFTLQMAGGGTQAAGTLELYELGEKIIVAGLFTQITIFGFFVVTSILFHLRAAKSPTPIMVSGEIPWKRHLYVLYATSALILVRSIFRVIEYLQGNAGYLISHEVFLYIFDMFLMAVTPIIFLIWYVDDLQPPRSKYVEEQGPNSSEFNVLESVKSST